MTSSTGSGKVLVIEDYTTKGRADWGVSLDGCNPYDSKYISCNNKEYAEMLAGKLNEGCPNCKQIAWLRPAKKYPYFTCNICSHSYQLGATFSFKRDSCKLEDIRK